MNLSQKSLISIALLVAGCNTTMVDGLGAPSECWPAWYNETIDATVDDQCPYGFSLPGYITWNNDMNPFLRCFNVLYGYVSYLLPSLVGLNALITRGTRELLFLTAIGIAAFVNEYFLKVITLEPRPVGACAITCGMPSGHSVSAIMYYVFLIVDYAFRVSPLEQESLPVGRRLRKVMRLLSNSNVEPLSRCEFFLVGFLWSLSLIPVPVSRVTNYDHTEKQVIAGAVIGVVFGLISYGVHYFLAKTVCSCAWQYPSNSKLHLLKNTIPSLAVLSIASQDKDCEACTEAQAASALRNDA